MNTEEQIHELDGSSRKAIRADFYGRCEWVFRQTGDMVDKTRFALIFKHLETNFDGVRAMDEVSQLAEYFAGVGLIPQTKNGFGFDNAQAVVLEAGKRDYTAESRRLKDLRGFMEASDYILNTIAKPFEGMDRRWIETHPHEGWSVNEYYQNHGEYRKLVREEGWVCGSLRQARQLVLLDALKTIETGVWPEKNVETPTLSDIFYQSFKGMLCSKSYFLND